MPSGKHVFVDTKGVNYLLDKYLTASDKEDLRSINTEHSKDAFSKALISKLEKRSGSRNWIPSNYEDELVENASAILGTNKRSAKLKNGRDVTVYETKSGKTVYEDRKGKLRDYRTGRYAKRKSFED